ncbi:BTAD domain-containing putative transcriptional regulator [Modestobacter sp. Leaf380]|uniref:AfsR/SARP family transcriptional regulator n=1 Tax=Modestobacter sp. Leaf380 TaxID=1736356 RepID=UPI0006F26E7D|nr:BTAD domain-containing putative transcriptional regulator [Modestobacter sp. Leaf380]KQS71311.1 hypothetical protein ASG41_20105 [Modestobacter sp. Leaf380]
MSILFRCLGDLEVVRGNRVLPAGGPLQLGLLAMLLLHANHSVSADRIVATLWPDPPDTALGQVQTRVWRLRQLLHGSVVEASGVRSHPKLVTRTGGYALMVDPAAVDHLVFDDEVRRATELLAAGHPQDAAALLRHALSLFRGPPFGNVPAPGVQAEAAPIERRRLAALELRIEVELGLGQHTHLIAELQELVAAHPFQERLRLHLMRALHRSGRRAEAVGAYRDGHRTMVDGAGLEPNRELKDLHQVILRSDEPAGAGGARPAPPPLRPRTARELPAGPVTLVGRCDQVAGLVGFLEAADGAGPRTAVISGPPGVGRTALAVSVAHALSKEPTHVQLFSRLDGAASPCQVLHQLLRAQGLADVDIPADVHARSALFRSVTASRRTVLVLDDADSEDVVRPLLPAGPGTVTLVTSLRPLTALDGALQVDLDPLCAAEGMRLLQALLGPERVDAEPDAATRIVAACVGRPLALRAAAARLAVRRHWSLTRYAAVLDDDEHRLGALSFADLDLRSAVAASCARVDDRALALLRRLAVAPDGVFTAADAERLVEGSRHLADELVEQLVEARVVRPPASDRADVPVGDRGYRIDELCRLLVLERSSSGPRRVPGREGNESGR